MKTQVRWQLLERFSGLKVCSEKSLIKKGRLKKFNPASTYNAPFEFLLIRNSLNIPYDEACDSCNIDFYKP